VRLATGNYNASANTAKSQRRLNDCSGFLMRTAGTSAVSRTGSQRLDDQVVIAGEGDGAHLGDA
jgi:hypothetical protein